MDKNCDELAESYPRLGRCLDIHRTQKDIIDPQTTCFLRKRTMSLMIRGVDRLVDGFVMYSPPFGVGGLMWRILLKVVAVDCDGETKHHLGFFTSCCSHPYSTNWKATVKSTLFIMTSTNGVLHRRTTEHEYSAKNYDWGFSQFGALETLRKKCFAKNSFKVRMEIDVVKIEQTLSFNKFINNLITRVDAPMKRLREGYVDEAIQLNNDVLRDSMGRNAWVIEKLKWQDKMLNKMKLKQSIKRIERGGVFSPTNDRITVKTALMGVPLPKHLSKQLSVLPKGVRVDMTTARLAVSGPKESGDHCNEADGCTCDSCFDNPGKMAKSSTSATSFNSDSMPSEAEEALEDGEYYTPDNSLVTYDSDESSSSSVCSIRSDSYLYTRKIRSRPVLKRIKVEPKKVTTKTITQSIQCTRTRMLLSDTAALAKIKYPDIGCDAEDLLGRMADGTTGMSSCRDTLLQCYFRKILQDESDLPLETFCENIRRDAVKNFEKILFTVLEFFKNIMIQISKMSSIEPPEFSYESLTYEVATDCLEYMDKCTDAIADFITKQLGDIESKRLNQVRDVKKSYATAIDALKSRTTSMLKIRQEAIKMQSEMKDVQTEVDKQDILIRNYLRLQSNRQDNMDELYESVLRREACRIAVIMMNERSSKHKKLVDTVVSESAALRKHVNEEQQFLKQVNAAKLDAVKEMTAMVDAKSEGMDELRKKCETIKREKIDILEEWKQTDVEAMLEIRDLDRRKLQDSCGIVQDEVEAFLEDCDNALRHRGYSYDVSQKESERAILRVEIEKLRRFEATGKTALKCITRHTNDCLRLFDSGYSLDDLPDVPVLQLPNIQCF